MSSFNKINFVLVCSGKSTTTLHFERWKTYLHFKQVFHINFWIWKSISNPCNNFKHVEQRCCGVFKAFNETFCVNKCFGMREAAPEIALSIQKKKILWIFDMPNNWVCPSSFFEWVIVQYTSFNRLAKFQSCRPTQKTVASPSSQNLIWLNLPRWSCFLFLFVLVFDFFALSQFQLSLSYFPTRQTKKNFTFFGVVVVNSSRKL